MLNYLTSPGYRSGIRNTRAFNWIRDWQPSDAEAEFLQNAFCRCDDSSTFPVDADTASIASVVAQFVHSGLITYMSESDSNRMQFASPTNAHRSGTAVVQYFRPVLAS